MFAKFGLDLKVVAEFGVDLKVFAKFGLDLAVFAKFGLNFKVFAKIGLDLIVFAKCGFDVSKGFCQIVYLRLLPPTPAWCLLTWCAKQHATSAPDRPRPGPRAGRPPSSPRRSQSSQNPI